MAVNTADFIKWVRQCLMGDGDMPCRMINLVHFPDYRQVRTWTIKHDDPPDQIAREMLKEGEQHARGLGEVQRYLFQAFFGENSDHSREFAALWNFRTIDDNDGGLTEGPTEKGVTAQLQRLLEATFRTSIGATGKVLDSWEATVVRLQEETEKLRNENEKLRGENRQMLNDQFKEALILRKVAFKEAQLEKLWGMIIPLAPTAISAGLKMLTGGKVNMAALPGAPSPIEQKIMAFGAHLKPEKFHQIMAVLDPAEQILLVDVFKDMKARFEAMQKDIQAKGGGPEHPKAPPTVAGDGKTPKPQDGGTSPQP
jgi:hypothetical protein